jgi:hypothetical protein
VVIWNGNPLDDIKTIEDESELKLIVKDGMTRTPSCPSPTNNIARLQNMA